MNRQRRRAWTVAVTALIGALAGIGVGFVSAGDTDRYESTATVAIVPFPGLPEDLSADFWQVLSEGQVVRTAAVIYSDGERAASAAAALGVPGTDVELSASALVDTALVQVSVQSDSAATSDAALAIVLGSAGDAAADILRPFVISEASVQPAELARSGAALQWIGAATVSGALLGAGMGLILSGFLRRGHEGGEVMRDEAGPRDVDSAVDDQSSADQSSADQSGYDEQSGYYVNDTGHYDGVASHRAAGNDSGYR